MNNGRIWVGAALALTMLAGSALAQPEGGSPVARGRNIALIVCSACHVVAPDQPDTPQLPQKTPSFQEIANRPDVSARSLRRFVTHTHWDQTAIPMTMPNPMLMSDQVDDVAAYIMSLRKR